MRSVAAVAVAVALLALALTVAAAPASKHPQPPAGAASRARHAAVVLTRDDDGTARWGVRDLAHKPRRGVFPRVYAGAGGALAPTPAVATWDDAIEATGWSWLTVGTNAGVGFSDAEQAYAAGYVEAYFTWNRIWQVAVNAGATNFSASCPAVVQSFLQQNRQWMEQQIATSAPGDTYWYQIGLIWRQLHGLVDGYNAYVQAPAQPLDFWSVWSLSGGDDMWELIGALTGVDGETGEAFAGGAGADPDSDTGAHDHCSAIVKVTPNNADLLFAHTSWEGAGNMLRTFKRYDFPWNAAAAGDHIVPATSIVFASYPGVLFSGDDWYQTSQQLAVLETTIHTFNLQWLYSQYIRPDTVMDWIRNMAANRLARSAPEWGTIFGRYNSGTYNNAFMVVDYKQWTAGQPVAPNTLWLHEQLPGYLISGDLSDRLRADTYYAGYNVAYFPQTFNLSGTAQMVAQYGDYYSYEKTARANIFRRDHAKVVDVASLQKLIRYNDFQNDPLSACSPCDPPYTSLFSISTRQDLDDPTGQYQWAFEGFRNHIGIDAKVTSAALMAADLQCMAQSGPTHDQQPVFQWSTSLLAPNVSHVGMPDLYDFGWYQVSL